MCVVSNIMDDKIAFNILNRYGSFQTEKVMMKIPVTINNSSLGLSKLYLLFNIILLLLVKFKTKVLLLNRI